MTVKQFKHWFEGFVNALELDLVSGFDHDDLEDIFDAIRKKMNEIETKEPINVPENLSHIPSTPPYPPYIYYTHDTNVDRLNAWPENYNSTNKK
jgi:hypothetical protein